MAGLIPCLNPGYIGPLRQFIAVIIPRMPVKCVYSFSLESFFQCLDVAAGRIVYLQFNIAGL